MIELGFEGWMQCRLANDPDPTDEKRGVSGCSFATAGEPDFDRIIRFQEPVVRRSFMPEVGVRVTSVVLDSEEAEAHPLKGASVELLNDAKFEEQNGIALQVNRAAIVPFDFRVSGPGGTRLRRAAVWDPDDPSKGLYDLPVDDPAVLNRQPKSFKMLDPDFLRDSGVGKPEDYLEIRRRNIEKALGDETDPVARAALEQRLAGFHRTDYCAERLPRMLGIKVLWAFGLNERGAEVSLSPGDAPSRPADTDRPWPLELWIGAWDNDALCAFVQGKLTLLFEGDPEPPPPVIPPPPETPPGHGN